MLFNSVLLETFRLFLLEKKLGQMRSFWKRPIRKNITRCSRSQFFRYLFFFILILYWIIYFTLRFQNVCAFVTIFENMTSFCWFRLCVRLCVVNTSSDEKICDILDSLTKWFFCFGCLLLIDKKILDTVSNAERNSEFFFFIAFLMFNFLFFFFDRFGLDTDERDKKLISNEIVFSFVNFSSDEEVINSHEIQIKWLKKIKK